MLIIPHRTLKDTVKAIQSSFAGNAHPLPDELQQTIEVFLDRHHNIEDGDSQRLHEELLSIHSKYVASNPELHGLFVHILRQLRPAIRGERRLEEWWTLVIRPTVDAVGHKRHHIEDAREFLLGIMVFDQDEDSTGEHAELSRQFTKRLMDAYLVRSKIPTSEGEVVSPEDEFIAQELEGILVAFGRKKPQVRADMPSSGEGDDELILPHRNSSWPLTSRLSRKSGDCKHSRSSALSSDFSHLICTWSLRRPSSSTCTTAF
jgi:hypothetical protein